MKCVATSTKNWVLSEYWSSGDGGGLRGPTAESVDRRLVLPASAGWHSVTGDDRVVPLHSFAAWCLRRNTVHRKYIQVTNTARPAGTKKDPRLGRHTSQQLQRSNQSEKVRSENKGVTVLPSQQRELSTLASNNRTQSQGINSRVVLTKGCCLHSC